MRLQNIMAGILETKFLIRGLESGDSLQTFILNLNITRATFHARNKISILKTAEEKNLIVFK